MKEFNGKQVTIMSCSSCNQKCKHCYINYKGDFTGKELLNICEKLHDKYYIIINGTEVLLHDDYFDALKISNQNRILTNGIVIHNNKKLIDKIKETNIGAIAMSYHFDSDVSNVPKSIVEDNIKLLKENGIEPQLMCTITNNNYDKLEEICKKALKLGVHTIRFFNCINVGNCSSLKKNICLTAKQKQIFLDNLRKIRDKYDEKVLRIKRNGTFGPDLNATKNNFHCTAGIDEVFIAPNLKVYPCLFMMGKGFEIGEYKNGKIYINDDYKNNGNICIACKIFNRN